MAGRIGAAGPAKTAWRSQTSSPWSFDGACPHQVLGIASDATVKQMRAAFLKLAKSSHPDLHPGDRTTEDCFKAATAATSFQILSDAPGSIAE